MSVDHPEQNFANQSKNNWQGNKTPSRYNEAEKKLLKEITLACPNLSV